MLQTRRPSERYRGVLGGRVGRHIHTAAQTKRGGDVDDRAALGPSGSKLGRERLLLRHLLELLADADEQAASVDVEGLVPLLSAAVKYS